MSRQARKQYNVIPGQYRTISSQAPAAVLVMVVVVTAHKSYGTNLTSKTERERENPMAIDCNQTKPNTSRPTNRRGRLKFHISAWHLAQPTTQTQQEKKRGVHSKTKIQQNEQKHVKKKIENPHKPNIAQIQE